MPNLAEQIREALSMFARNDTQPALIGGLAVVAHQVIRATKDVDFLVAAETADKVHDALLNLGYQCLYRSEDAANYVRGTEGLDLLYAPRSTWMSYVNTLAYSTNRNCSMNCSDNAVTKAEAAQNGAIAGAVLAREAGVPFRPQLGKDSGVDPIAEWLSLMEVVQMLCPVWPVRDSPMQGDHWKL
jgi:hypothetical protein